MRSSIDLQADGIPEQEIDRFRTAVTSVIKGFERAGLSQLLKNPPKFSLRHRLPEDQGANGRFDHKTDSVLIFYPQVNYSDITYAIAHEISHRIWDKSLSKDQQNIWSHTISALGRKMPSEMIDHNIDVAIHNGRSPLWFWYKLNVNNNIEGFRNYLKTLNYVPSNLPRMYSNASPSEAWADVIASMVLGRSHNRNLMSKTGSLPSTVAAKIIDQVRHQSVNEAKEPAKRKYVIPKSVIFGDEQNRNVLSGNQ